MSDIDIAEVVKKLIGPVFPVGCSQRDSDRLTNLKQLTALTDELLTLIQDVANDSKNSYESSVKEAGKFADNFFNYIISEFDLEDRLSK